MRGRLSVTGAAPISTFVATAFLCGQPAHADPAPSPEVAYCRDMATLGHHANCVTLANYGHSVCTQFDKGTDWHTILTQLDTVTLDQQFSADILVAAVNDICPWNESKKP